MRLPQSKSLRLAAIVGIFVCIGIGGLFLSQAADYQTAGDVDGDGTITLQDAARLIASFDSSNTMNDLDHDGSVGILDLSLLLANLNQVVHPPSKPSKLLGLNASANPAATDSKVATRLGADFRRADVNDIHATLPAGSQPVLAILYPSWDATGVGEVIDFVSRNADQLIGISIGNENGYANNTGTYARGAEYATFWRQLMLAKASLTGPAKSVPFLMDFDSGGRGDSPEAARWAKQIVMAGFPNPDMIELHAYGPNYMNKINDDLALLPTSWKGKVAITEFGVQVRYSGGTALQPGKTYGDTPQPMTLQNGARIVTERVTNMLTNDRISMVSIYSAYDTAAGSDGDDHFWGLAYHNGEDKPYMADAFRALKRSLK